MYSAEEVRQRFIAEVARLKALGVDTSVTGMEQACGLKQGDIWRITDIKRPAPDIRASVLSRFVQTYRAWGISYEYICEGRQPKSVQPDDLKQLEAKLTKAIQETLEEEKAKWQLLLK